MYGLLIASDDNEIVVTILPFPADNRFVILSIVIDGLMLPPIQIPVHELEMLLEGRNG